MRLARDGQAAAEIFKVRIVGNLFDSGEHLQLVARAEQRLVLEVHVAARRLRFFVVRQVLEPSRRTSSISNGSRANLGARLLCRRLRAVGVRARSGSRQRKVEARAVAALGAGIRNHIAIVIDRK